MSVSRYATQAGKKYERDLMVYLREQGFDTERLRLNGVEDEGDLLVRLGQDPSHRRFVIEAKRTKSLDLAGWVKEAELERINYETHRQWTGVGFLVVHARRNHGIGKSYVTTTLDEFLRWFS